MSQIPFRRRTYHKAGWRDYRVTAHFKLGEFLRDQERAPEPHVVDMVAAFARRILEPLRSKYGACVVVSGHRTKARNRAVGGAPRSWHVWEEHPGEMAVDVVFARASPPVWARAAREGHAGGIGVYRSHVHLDDGPSRTWSSGAP